MSSKRKAPQAKARTVPSVLGWRFAFVLLSLAAVFSALVARAAWLQVVEPDMLVSQGDMRSLRVEADTVLRGMILDRNGEELAVSVPVEAIWADPKVVIERHAAADERRWHALAEHFDGRVASDHFPVIADLSFSSGGNASNPALAACQGGD